MLQENWPSLLWTSLPTALAVTQIPPLPRAAGRASSGAAVPLDPQRIRPSEPAFTPSWQLWLSISAVDRAAVVSPPKRPLLHDKLSGLLPPAVFTALDATTGMEGSKRVKFQDQCRKSLQYLVHGPHGPASRGPDSPGPTARSLLLRPRPAWHASSRPARLASNRTHGLRPCTFTQAVT